MSEYTKGTWVHDVLTGEILGGSHKIGEVYGATIHNHTKNAAECFSNARLIINAPELFSLVNNLLNYVRKYHSTDIEPAYKFALKAVIERAESVITRIEEGESRA